MAEGKRKTLERSGDKGGKTGRDAVFKGKKASIMDKTTKSRDPDCSGVRACSWSKYLHPAYMLLNPIVLAYFAGARFNKERALNRT